MLYGMLCSFITQHKINTYKRIIKSKSNRGSTVQTLVRNFYTLTLFIHNMI